MIRPTQTHITISGFLTLTVSLALLAGCASAPSSIDGLSSTPNLQPSSTSSTPSMETSTPHSIHADVLAVETSGESGSYRFAVTIQSPDTGCDQYANWWEVVSSEGELIHRRILLHSHVSEQPFTRSSGPVEIDAAQSVVVRAHMHPSGYGGQVFQGSVDNGFTVTDLPDDFAAHLATQPPLPTGCNF